MTVERVVVEVPATSANLGPGFDSLGLALGLTDQIEARFVDGTDVLVDVSGEGAGQVPCGEANLVARIVRTGLATFDESGELARRGLALTCANAIPHSRGLGSSAAAIVGGLVVATHLAACAGALVWSGLEWLQRGKPSVLGVVSGAVAVALAAALGAVARRALGRRGVDLVGQAFAAALIAGLAGAVSIVLDVTSAARLVAVCPAMVLVPGPHLLNGVLDLAAKRMSIGLGRVTYGSLIVLAICAGGCCSGSCRRGRCR